MSNQVNLLNSPMAATAQRALHIIGYGAVGQAFHRLLLRIGSVGSLADHGISSVAYWAPEIKERKVEGLFSFNPSLPVERATLASVLDKINPAAGDILVELATRIDTQTIWAECKRRGVHFVNSGFDVWGDVVLDLAGLDELRNNALWSSGEGLTSVFSFGCNPGIASHFVSHGLKVATGLSDIGEAAKAFGLSSIIFSERDTQWPVPGTPAEKKLMDTQTTVLYNTWSPGNYIVETAESTLMYAGMPPEAAKVNAASPTVLGWIPSGPIVGFMPPHDETFTIQPWFHKTIPSLFVYEASPTARNYLKGGKNEESSHAKCVLLTPTAFSLASDGYDMLGALMFSDKPGVPPYWSGITMDVTDAAAIDPTGSSGPTALQVTGGVWTAVKYVITHPNAGDRFSEDVPTDFVMSTAFPWSGRVVTRPAPEALNVVGLFNPAAPTALADILAGEVKPERLEAGPSPMHGKGTFANTDISPGTALIQLSIDGDFLPADLAINHSCEPNAYIDRNRIIRALKHLQAGDELTIDYALIVTSTEDVGIAACKCGTARCRGKITNWTALPASDIHQYLTAAPIHEFIKADIRAYFQ